MRKKENPSTKINPELTLQEMLKHFLRAEGKIIPDGNMGLHKGMKSTRKVMEWINTQDFLFSYFKNSLKDN